MPHTRKSASLRSGSGIVEELGASALGDWFGQLASDGAVRNLHVCAPAARLLSLDERDVPADAEFSDLFPAPFRSDLRRAFLGIASGLESLSLIIPLEGLPLRMRAFADGPADAQGLIPLCGTLEDARRELRDAERAQIFKEVFDHAGDAIVVTDADNFIVEVNASFEAITGYSFDDVRGKNPSVLSAGKTSDAVYRQMWADLVSVGRWRGEVIDRRKDGQEYAKTLSISVVRDDCGNVVRHVGMFFDISKLRRAEEAAAWLAARDPLTGLYNRRTFSDEVAYLAEAVSDPRAVFALLVVGLDGFKRVNEVYGQKSADAVLEAVGAKLLAFHPASLACGRVGGDEFAVAIPVDGPDEASSAADCLLSLIETPVHADGQDLIPVRACVGAAVFPLHADNGGDLFRRAQIALRSAKASGSAVAFFDPAAEQEASAAAWTESALRADIHRPGAFELHYQIQTRLEDQAPVGFEALVRWRTADGSLVSPDKFIPVAERSGLIVAVGEIVLREACRQARAWLDAGLRAPIAVNFSPRQFQDPELARKVRDALAVHGLGPGAIEAEITESCAMSDPEQTARILDELADAGIRCSIDDFGTGYSSLAHLRRLPVSKIKLDRSFVLHIETSPADLAICQAACSMGKALGIETLAEGIETPEQGRLLREAGCGMGQGYYWSKPLPAKLASEKWTSLAAAAMNL